MKPIFFQIKNILFMLKLLDSLIKKMILNRFPNKQFIKHLEITIKLYFSFKWKRENWEDFFLPQWIIIILQKYRQVTCFLQGKIEEYEFKTYIKNWLLKKSLHNRLTDLNRVAAGEQVRVQLPEGDPGQRCGRHGRSCCLREQSQRGNERDGHTLEAIPRRHGSGCWRVGPRKDSGGGGLGRYTGKRKKKG